MINMEENQWEGQANYVFDLHNDVRFFLLHFGYSFLDEADAPKEYETTFTYATVRHKRLIDGKKLDFL